MVSISTVRQQIIFDLLKERKTIKIQELVDQLNVSPMTIHRDLHQLAIAGLVVKVHGGVTLAPVFPENGPLSEGCSFCRKTIPVRTLFVIRGTSGEPLHACCPHCGLLMLSRQAGSVMALTTDFLYGQMVSAQQAVYLVESGVDICCAPSALSFATQETAQRFRQGFGGRIMDIEQIQRYLNETMTLTPRAQHGDPGHPPQAGAR